MSTIKSNNFLNKTIITEENLNNYNSNFKTLFSPLYKEELSLYRKIQLITDNINFCYSGEDFVNKVIANNINYDILISDKYNFVSQDEYIYSDYNYIYKLKKVKKTESFKSKYKPIIYHNLENLESEYAFENNVIIFYSSRDKNLLYEFEYDEKIKIKDMLIKDDFVMLIISYLDNDFICLSHLGFEFCNNNLKFEEIECFYKIPLNALSDIKLIDFEGNKITVFDTSKKEILELYLGKKYFFFDDVDNPEYIYFTENESVFKNGEVIDTIQLEHLFCYDITSFFGLNNLKDSKGNKKINSKNFLNKEDLFTFKFDDTLNGALNFFDLEKPKDYRILVKDKIFKIYGNFVNKYENGVYKITIQTLKPKENTNSSFEAIVSLFKKENEIYNKIKEINVNTIGNSFYFCNLKFDIISFYNFNYDFYFDIDINDDYSVEIINNNLSLNGELTNTTYSFLDSLKDNLIIKTNNKIKSIVENDTIGTSEFLNNNVLEVNNKIIMTKKIPINDSFNFDKKQRFLSLQYNENIENKTFEPVLKNKNKLTIKRIKFDIDFNSI